MREQTGWVLADTLRLRQIMLKEEGDPCPPATIADEMEAKPLNDELHKVTVPTLIIWGRHDKLIERVVEAQLPTKFGDFSVVGDPLDVISSGPTSPDPTTFADAVAVIYDGRRHTYAEIDAQANRALIGDLLFKRLLVRDASGRRRPDAGIPAGASGRRA